jgi:OOP family OmpA-OmpF porin
MVKHCFRSAAVFLGLLLLASCAQVAPMAPFSPVDLSGKVSSGAYVPKVDNFAVLLDASSSMGETYKGQVNAGHSKFVVAKDLVDRMNRTMPPMDITGALTAFGLSPVVSKDAAITTFGPAAYDQAKFAGGLKKVSAPGGTTPMGMGFEQLGADFKDAQGKMAVIVFSDGEENTIHTPAVKAAGKLKEQWGDRLCIYTVFVGNEDSGRKLLEDLAKAGGCGFATTADQISSPDGMADFVQKVFLAEAAAKPMAQPAPPPAPAPKITWILSGVNFDLDKAVVRPDAKEVLQKDIKILKENPEIKVEIQGHTCDLGDARYNQGLSERRAQAVKEYLISQGIAASRLTSKGYGEERPRFPNDGEPNRARNRRVEMVPMP